MSEMVERVARAIMSVREYKGPQAEYYERLARAAIEAMREPTEGMMNRALRAGVGKIYAPTAGYERDRDKYQAMIDAAFTQ